MFKFKSVCSTEKRMYGKIPLIRTLVLGNLKTSCRTTFKKNALSCLNSLSWCFQHCRRRSSSKSGAYLYLPFSLSENCYHIWTHHRQVSFWRDAAAALSAFSAPHPHCDMKNPLKVQFSKNSVKLQIGTFGRFWWERTLLWLFFALRISIVESFLENDGSFTFSTFAQFCRLCVVL